MDFTAANIALTGEIINNTALFSKYVDSILNKAGARYGIGGYGEHRTVYSRSSVFDGSDDEPRRLHLGLDIWGKAGTEVYAPLDGEIHSFAFNDHLGDYGATIILQHNYCDLNFYTLYGHLSLEDLKIQKGTKIRKGALVGHFGTPVENGNWPPHLHFQLIQQIGPYVGDYPGVCKYSEREQYLSNCLDPDLLARLFRYVVSV
jgi:murein DD-endopeptidase MepM/ murein hydrolase activator NlpD